MKKQKLQLAVLVIVLLVLGGGYLGLRRYNKVQSEKETEEEGEALVSLEQEDIIRFTYDYEDAEYTFEKEGDTWYYAQDHELALIQYRLTAIASNLAGLTAQDTITGVEDLSLYGLQEPSRTFSFETESESYVFYAGDYNELTDVYYIRKPSGDTVYTVEASVIDAFDLSPEDIADTSEEESEEESTETSDEEGAEASEEENSLVY